MQTGIECIGDIDINDIFEVVYLAAKSLDTISSDFVLDISHMGVFSAILDSVLPDEMFKKEATKLVSQKNRHETYALCKKYSVSDEDAALLVDFIGLYGEPSSVIERLNSMIKNEKGRRAYEELVALCSLLAKTEFKDKIKLDFSVVNDMNYYNGIVFKGFLYGISEGVLSGGEYGRLVKRMGKDNNAIGFAIYLDLLESLESEINAYDVDVLLIYDKNSSAEALLELKNKIIASGESVSCQLSVPEKLRYKKLIKLSEDIK
jgi:ATP phosphoribosyltransferase regulatory subunit